MTGAPNNAGDADIEQHAIAVTSKTHVRVGLAQLGVMLSLGIGGATWATAVSADIKAIKDDIADLASDRWAGVDSTRYRLRLQAAVDLWEERMEALLANALGKPLDIPHLVLPDTNEGR